MPRVVRIDTPGLLHHVMIRGIERRKIFRDNKDRENLIDRLSDLLPETRTECYAWVFMPNHAHFLLRSGPKGIAALMRRPLTGYAATYNKRHRRHGQLFQNRYKSIICQEDAYIQELVRYIHLNPLRAKIIIDLQGLDKYAKGDADKKVNILQSPAFLFCCRVRALFPGNTHFPALWWWLECQTSLVAMRRPLPTLRLPDEYSAALTRTMAQIIFLPASTFPSVAL